MSSPMPEPILGSEQHDGCSIDSLEILDRLGNCRYAIDAVGNKVQMSDHVLRGMLIEIRTTQLRQGEMLQHLLDRLA